MLFTSCTVCAALPTSVRLLLILPLTLSDTVGSAPQQGFEPETLESDSKRHIILPLSYWYWSKSSGQKLNWYSALSSSFPSASLNLDILISQDRLRGLLRKITQKRVTIPCFKSVAYCVQHFQPARGSSWYYLRLCQTQSVQHPDRDSNKAPWNLKAGYTAFYHWATSTGLKVQSI